jgi:hypothetical protein
VKVTRLPFWLLVLMPPSGEPFNTTLRQPSLVFLPAPTLMAYAQTLLVPSASCSVLE